MVWPDPVATLIASVAAFMFGAIYYTALAGPWRRAAGVSAEDARQTPAGHVAILVLTALIVAGVGWLLATIGIINSVPSGVIVMAMAWLTLVFAPIALNYRAQRRSPVLTAIDTLYWLLVIEIATLIHIYWAGAPKFS